MMSVERTEHETRSKTNVHRPLQYNIGNLKLSRVSLRLSHSHLVTLTVILWLSQSQCEWPGLVTGLVTLKKHVQQITHFAQNANINLERRQGKPLTTYISQPDNVEPKYWTSSPPSNPLLSETATHWLVGASPQGMTCPLRPAVPCRDVIGQSTGPLPILSGCDRLATCSHWPSPDPSHWSEGWLTGPDIRRPQLLGAM